MNSCVTGHQLRRERRIRSGGERTHLLETRVALRRKRKAGKLHVVEDADYHGADGISQRVHSPIRSLDAIHAAGSGQVSRHAAPL